MFGFHQKPHQRTSKLGKIFQAGKGSEKSQSDRRPLIVRMQDLEHKRLDEANRQFDDIDKARAMQKQAEIDQQKMIKQQQIEIQRAKIRAGAGLVAKPFVAVGKAMWQKADDGHPTTQAQFSESYQQPSPQNPIGFGQPSRSKIKIVRKPPQ